MTDAATRTNAPGSAFIVRSNASLPPAAQTSAISRQNASVSLFFEPCGLPLPPLFPGRNRPVFLSFAIISLFFQSIAAMLEAAAPTFLAFSSALVPRCGLSHQGPVPEHAGETGGHAPRFIGGWRDAKSPQSFQIPQPSNHQTLLGLIQFQAQGASGRSLQRGASCHSKTGVRSSTLGVGACVFNEKPGADFSGPGAKLHLTKEARPCVTGCQSVAYPKTTAIVSRHSRKRLPMNSRSRSRVIIRRLAHSLIVM